MKRMSKKIMVVFLLLLMGVSVMVFPVSAANGIVLTSSADSAQPGKSITVTVGISLDAGVSGGQLEVTYNPSMLWFSKTASEKTPGVTDTLTVDETNGKITIVFAPEEIDMPRATQNLIFVVTNNSTPGSKSDVTVQVTRASDSNFTELNPSQDLGGGTVKKTITVASAPTQAPTLAPTTTPAWTPGATTPVQTLQPTGTEEIDPNATPGESEGTSEEEEPLEPSETPELVPTMTPEITRNPISSPEATDDQALLIKTGALGFWMMVVLIVGIWIGIALGYFIWGRKQGRHVRRSKVIGNDEF